MNKVLKILFAENPYIAEEVCAFCNNLPEYQKAEQLYHVMEDKLCQEIGFEAFDVFDQAQTNYIAKLANAYYLFGLGLRQELIRELL